MSPLLGLVLGLLAPTAHAVDFDLEYGGAVQADIRFGLPPKNPLPWYAPRPDIGAGIARDELRWKNRMYVRSGRFGAKMDVDLVLPGYMQEMSSINDASYRPNVGPVWFEANQLYLEGYDLLPGLDLRVGNQIIDWGAGDRFNPTNTLNPNDLEDVLLFGDQVGTLMARADYTPAWWLTFTSILVPVFRPALVPLSTPYAVAHVDRLPWYEDELRWQVHAENEAAGIFGYPTVVTGSSLDVPGVSWQNLQYAFRIGALAGPVDFALSYYRGFSDTPVPVGNSATQTENPRCTPFDQCINGTIDTTIDLAYPRMQVVGLNVAGEAVVGFRLEAGLFIPERRAFNIHTGDLAIGPIVRPGGEYPYPSGSAPMVLDGRPFAKWSLGVDYSFGKHVYTNAQWVHGFPGEFGAGDWMSPGLTVLRGGVSSDPAGTIGCALAQDGTRCAEELSRNRIGDYIVAGIDVKLLNANALSLKVFGIIDLTGGQREAWSEQEGARVVEKYSPFSSEMASGVVYPEVQYNFGNGLELHGGALLQLGRDYTKFGDPQVGGSMIFTRAKFSY